MMRPALAGFAAAVWLVACAPAAIPETKTVSLRMRGKPANATVTIDDVLVGPLDVVQARGVALPPGAHRISVEANGFLPWDRSVEARDQPVVLDVVLMPIPD